MDGFASYEHPQILLFVSWVGGCLVYSSLFTGGDSYRLPCSFRG